MSFAASLFLIFWSSICVGAGAQEAPPKPDISLAESKRISPFPPKSATVKFSEGRAKIRWVKAASEKVAAYEIYRSVDGAPMKKLGRTKDLSFVDNPPADKAVSYAVAAVDIHDNVSHLRPAKAE